MRAGSWTRSVWSISRTYQRRRPAASKPSSVAIEGARQPGSVSRGTGAAPRRAHQVREMQPFAWARRITVRFSLRNRDLESREHAWVLPPTSSIF